MNKESTTNVNIAYVGQSYQQVANAGSKPSRDFEDVLERMHVHNIGLRRRITNSGRKWWIWNRLSALAAMIRMPRNGVVILQYPEQPLIHQIFNKAKKRNNRIIALIHDINELRGFPSNYPDLLRAADVLIAHTPAMKLWIEKNINTYVPVVELGIFDYLGKETFPSVDLVESKSIDVVFAGRLDKSPFLKELMNIPQHIQFVLYGLGFDPKIAEKGNVSYRGACLPEELSEKISRCHFGLVWDGESIEQCNGKTGNYLKYNSPYKLSSYIAAGLPVIIWNQMAMSDFVKENKIGIAVSDLKEAAEMISDMTSEDYKKMRDNVTNIQCRIQDGYYSRQAISRAINLLQ